MPEYQMLHASTKAFAAAQIAEAAMSAVGLVSVRRETGKE
jgi:hypothetical protein